VTTGRLQTAWRRLSRGGLLLVLLIIHTPVCAAPWLVPDPQMPGTTERPAAAVASPHQRTVAEDLQRVLLLKDYNTRMVLLGTCLLGVSAALVGTFTLLRKRALIGDVASHASLPGIALAFLIAEIWHPGTGRSLTTLSIGAAIAGSFGVLCTVAIRRFTRIPDDAAGAIVLSTFFGLGIALFTVIQNIPSGQSAGLKHFIVGRAASLVADDVWVIAEVSIAVLIVCLLLFKEFSFLCFDADYACSQGWPVWRLDLLLMSLVVSVAVIGEQSVGLLLVVALLIIPATSARFWTYDLRWLAAIASAIGAGSAVLGVVISAVIPRFSTGPVIVLTGSACFVLSLLFGSQLGLVRRLRDNLRVKRLTMRSDLLRALYEIIESAHDPAQPLTTAALTDFRLRFDVVQQQRGWSKSRLQRGLKSALGSRLVYREDDDVYRLTRSGAAEAQQVVRNHRLWELYLITYAEVAASHVDHIADLVEHVLAPEVIDELSNLVSAEFPQMRIPESPHLVTPQPTGLN